MTQPEHIRDFAFDTLSNVRDMGGFLAEDGRQTKWRKYVRSSCVGTLSEAEKECLYQHGIRLIIDLRYPSEVDEAPSPLKDYRTIEYRFINLLKNFSFLLERPELDMGDLYVAWSENAKPQIAETLKLMARYPDVGVLFHCSAGKDRTGMIAALLMGLAGCSRADIVSSYSESYENIRMSRYTKQIPSGQQRYLYSKPEYMHKLLDHLEENYGGIVEYIAHIGLDDATRAALKEAFIQ